MVDRAYTTRTFASPTSPSISARSCRAAAVNSTSLRAFAADLASSCMERGGRARARAFDRRRAAVQPPAKRASRRRLPTRSIPGPAARRTVRGGRTRRCGEHAAPTEPGTLHLFHGLDVPDVDVDDALRALVAGSRPPNQPAHQAALHRRAGESLLRSVDPDAAARAARVARPRGADAQRWRRASARRAPVRGCDGDADAACAAREAALEAAQAFSRSWRRRYAAPRARGARLVAGRGHLLGPTPPANGTLRALRDR